MRLVVTHPDGRQETVALGESVRVIHGRELNRLTDGVTEQFFDKDGYYDGWGQLAASAPETEER